MSGQACPLIRFLYNIRDCFSWANTSVRPYGFSAFMVSFFAYCRGWTGVSALKTPVNSRGVAEFSKIECKCSVF